MSRRARLKRLVGHLHCIWKLVLGLDRTEQLRETDRVSYTTARITLGAHSYGKPRIVISDGADDSSRVLIGKYCSIGLDVLFMEGGNHPTDWVPTYPVRVQFGLDGAFRDGHPYDRGDVKVGNDVWIGRGSRIKSGVTIGNGSVIAGYSVVVKDVPPYAIVGGNPAKVIRTRFSDSETFALEPIAWWDWPDGKVIANVDLRNGGRIADFIARHLDQSELSRGTAPRHPF